MTDIDATNSANVAGTLTLQAAVDDSAITFVTTASVFNALAAQADNSVATSVDVSSDTGILYLDGDSENSATDDSVNNVVFSAAVLTIFSNAKRLVIVQEVEA